MDKRCKQCGEVKALADFYRHPGCRDGYRPECKACNLAEKARRNAANPEPARKRVRRWAEANPDRVTEHRAKFRANGRKKLSDRASYLKRKYGITLEEYDAKLAEQGGVCAICGREPQSDISLHVDHDHVTGAIRGLLCFSCNVTIGHIREDPDQLRAIHEYLDAHDPRREEITEAIRARLRALPGPMWMRLPGVTAGQPPLASGGHAHSALRSP